MQCYLVCFDISDDRARTRVGKVLLRHGFRVQESVFEIMVNGEVTLKRIRKQIESLLDDEVEVRFYRLCLDCRASLLRRDKIIRHAELDSASRRMNYWIADQVRNDRFPFAFQCCPVLKGKPIAASDHFDWIMHPWLHFQQHLLCSPDDKK